jgi:hypothetical protein
MKIPAELGGRLCGIMSACWSDSYPDAIAFASALEKLAAEARVYAAKKNAEYDGDRIIG